MRKSLLPGWAVTVIALLAVSPTLAADPTATGKIQFKDLFSQKKSLPLLSDQSLAEAATDKKPIVRVALTPSTAKTGDIVTLSVSVQLPPGTHTYSTSPESFSPTRIDIANVFGLTPKGDFEADQAPTISTEPTTGKRVEEFTKGVTWLRPFTVTATSPENVRLEVSIDLKYCNASSCRPFSEKYRVRLGAPGAPDSSPTASAESAITKVVPPTKSGHAKLTFSLAPSKPKPGEVVTLSVAMHLDPEWHTFSTTPSEGLGATPTEISLTLSKSLRPIGNAFQADHEPEVGPRIGDQAPSQIYQGDVTWTRRFKYEPKTGGSGVGIAGKIHYGTCNERMCLPPKSVEFSLGDLGGAGPLPAALPADSSPASSSWEFNPTLVAAAERSLGVYLGMAFLGGMILNVMPCVLPVLAIKVLSFVQQGGESRSRVLALNLAYTAGVLSVFLTLATLSAGARIGLTSLGHFSWGGLFGDTRFNLVMACLVFAMGLSLLGVFEIPVPGMVGSAAGKNQREGFLGAFLTGIFATLLATPCTGPVMTTALGWLLTQPAASSST